MRTADASDSDVKATRRRGVRIKAKIDADLGAKPRRAAVKPRSIPSKPPTSRKRKRQSEVEDDTPGPVEKYRGAEGSLEDVPVETKAKPKKPDAYVENCSGPMQLKRKKISSLERYLTLRSHLLSVSRFDRPFRARI